ncbi:MAG: phosphonate metabolism transcriptional regulator PhnF [Cyanobacteria bacterium J06623_4]
MSVSDSPIYIQISDQLRNSIQAGRYQVGDKLPPESELAQQFGVNRHTLRQAIALLRQEGALRVDRGKGTFVAAAPIRYAIGKRVRYNQSMRSQGYATRSEIVRAVPLPANDIVSNGLAIEVNAPVALIERVSFIDEVPVSISASHFPLALFPDLLSAESTAQLRSIGSISAWLRDRYDVDHIRRQTVVSARIVRAQDAKLLALSLNQPILLAESVNEDQEGRIIEYGVTKFRGDRMEMVFEN